MRTSVMIRFSFNYFLVTLIDSWLNSANVMLGAPVIYIVKLTRTEYFYMLRITKCSVINKSHIRSGSNSYININVKFSKKQHFSNDLNSCNHEHDCKHWSQNPCIQISYCKYHTCMATEWIYFCLLELFLNSAFLQPHKMSQQRNFLHFL